MNAKTDESHGAVAGKVERPVRPRAWACVWPAEDGCGGGGFTTLDPRAAENYMAGANESADSGRSKCRPTLVTLYDAQAVEALVRAAVECAVEVCAVATGQHRAIAAYVNKADLGNKVLAMADGVWYGA